MDMVVIVRPTLEEYSSQVHAMAEKYGFESWLELFENQEKMSEDERDDFSFITMAVGDQLIHREFISPSQSPGEDDLEDVRIGHGLIPGSNYFTGGDA